MANLTREDVLKLAQLARLELTEDEIQTFQKELSEVLDYVTQLNDVAVDGLEPTTQVTGLKNVLREDEVIDYGVSPSDLMKLPPATQDSHIKVKRMIG